MAHLVIHDQEYDSAWLARQWGQPIQRIFWIHQASQYSLRGKHRHQDECQMVLHCPVGKVTVYVQDIRQDHTYILNNKNQYLFLDGKDWRLMYGFSKGAILTVFVNTLYEQTLYINQPYRLYDMWFDKEIE